MNLAKIVMAIGLVSGPVYSADFKYVGKCSWDNTTKFDYQAGHALAEFFLETKSGTVYVKNYIDEVGGDFREIPETPPVEDLQEAGRQGVRNYRWDAGASEVSCAGRPFKKVRRCTNTRNSLRSSGNVYAPCYFVSE